MPREYPEFPIPSVGVVVVRDARVLLVQRGREPARGRWTIPGGVVELGETLHEAARRELREECGLEVEPVRLLQAFDAIVRDDEGRVRFHYVILDLLARYRGGDVAIADDVDDARWFALDDLHSVDVMEDAAQLVRDVLMNSQP